MLLIVEDSRADATILIKLLKEAGVSKSVVWLKSGDEAVSFLRREGDYEKRLTPSLVLLDLGLPGRPGQEVLVEMRGTAEFSKVPIVIFTGSRGECWFSSVIG
jgi:chemotaxis family two-component system response regulator Rcp1